MRIVIFLLLLLFLLFDDVSTLPIMPMELLTEPVPIELDSITPEVLQSEDGETTIAEAAAAAGNDEEGLTVPPPRFIPIRVDATVDTNGDGVLDVDEVRYAAFVHHGLSASVVEDMFKQVDINHDNVLDAREFDAIRLLVLEKAENAALRYLQNVDTDRDGLLSLQEAKTYLLKEYGIGYSDVNRLWKLVADNMGDRLNSTLFSRLRRRVRGMTIRLARQIMKTADINGDGHISVDEAQNVAFEQEGIGAGDVASMVGSVDENMDGELNAPEFADFERIVRARALENSKKAMRVVDADNSGTLTLDEAKRVAFEHYGFDEETLAPFFGQADENEDGQLDTVEFAGFRSVIRARSVRDAMEKMKRVDTDGDMLISTDEATDMTKKEDDMDGGETIALFNIADQNKSGKLDKVEFADFNRLVRLSSIKFATDHFKEFDLDGNDAVTFEEIALLIEQKYGIPQHIIKTFFNKIDVDKSGDLNPAEIVDFRHLIRDHVSRQRQDKVTTTTASTITTTTSSTTTTSAPTPPSSSSSSSSSSPSEFEPIPTLVHETVPTTTTSARTTKLSSTTMSTSTEAAPTEPSTTAATSPSPTPPPSTKKAKKPKTTTKPEDVSDGIDDDDVIAQDIAAPEAVATAPKASTPPPSPSLPRKTFVKTTTTPATTTTKKVSSSSAEEDEEDEEAPTEEPTTLPSTTTTTKQPLRLTTASKKITRKPPTTTTTTTSAPEAQESEVIIEEIVYEDENGNRMTPKKRKAGKNNDVSYEEIIEYVDEPSNQ